MTIAKGFGLIAGRSRENAKAALAAAEEAGLTPAVVLTNDDGYIVPEAVLDLYEANAKLAYDLAQDEADEAAKAQADADAEAKAQADADEKAKADAATAAGEALPPTEADKPLTAAQKKAAAKAAADDTKTPDAPASA